ncbi:YHYH protein, partial [Thermus thermophilus]|uniref:YHYH protein n=1 Tax=Thermus thermophilus TaxID=274 RepID=UPI0013FDBC28|nr:YHYH protein [Thermus thermophilus]
VTSDIVTYTKDRYKKLQSELDSSNGYAFQNYNPTKGYGYGIVANPSDLRTDLNDDGTSHSPILGFAYDGNPIYGPYGYSDPTNQSSSISRLRTSYRLKANLVYDEVTNPTPVRTDGPLLSEEIAGKFVEDYEYSFSVGDLDQYNGRFCKTPEYPTGRYCYFVTIEATEQGNPV